MESKLPNFLIIGAPKAGTTSLYKYLQAHPQIFLPDKKEPHFFSFEGRERGFNGPGQVNFIKKRVTKFEDYQQLFTTASNGVSIGEASTSYLYIPSAAERIKKYLPDIKLIAILRQPVDRAYSHYLHHYRNGGEVNLSLTEAICDEKKRQEEGWSPFWQYQEIGFYHKHLSHLFDVFDPKNIKVCFHEDLCENPQDLLKDIFLFLGVDLDAEYTLPSKKYNVSTISEKPRSKVLHNFLNRESWFKSLAKSILDDSIRGRIRHFVSQKNNVKIAQPYKPKLSSEEWNELNKAYKQDILSLQELLGRDLGHWLTRKSSISDK